MAWGLGSSEERLRRFAQSLRDSGHPELSEGLLKAIEEDSRAYMGETNKTSAKYWMSRHSLDGELLSVHWNRLLTRERQARFRDQRGWAPASINVDSRTKQKLARLKQPGETWSDLLNRLAQSPPAARGRKR